jgi:hypothetical protein
MRWSAAPQRSPSSAVVPSRSMLCAPAVRRGRCFEAFLTPFCGLWLSPVLSGLPSCCRTSLARCPCPIHVRAPFWRWLRAEPSAARWRAPSRLRFSLASSSARRPRCRSPPSSERFVTLQQEGCGSLRVPLPRDAVFLQPVVKCGAVDVQAVALRWSADRAPSRRHEWDRCGARTVVMKDCQVRRGGVPDDHEAASVRMRMHRRARIRANHHALPLQRCVE